MSRFTISQQLEEIERFRYDIYIAEQRQPLLAANHSTRRLADAEDKSAYHFVFVTLRKRLLAILACTMPMQYKHRLLKD